MTLEGGRSEAFSVFLLLFVHLKISFESSCSAVFQFPYKPEGLTYSCALECKHMLLFMDFMGASSVPFRKPFVFSKFLPYLCPPCILPRTVSDPDHLVP